MAISSIERLFHVLSLVTLIVALVVFVTLHNDNVYVVAGLTCVEVFVVVLRHEHATNRDRELERLQELQEQLIINEEQLAPFHRIDATAKEAAEGFTRCLVCGFENFKRGKFCSVCGEPIVHANWCEDKEVVVVPEPPQKPANMLTKRQLRARKRHEWKRKLDVDGNLFWYREHQNSLENSTVSAKSTVVRQTCLNASTTPGWTLVFTLVPVLEEVATQAHDGDLLGEMQHEMEQTERKSEPEEELDHEQTKQEQVPEQEPDQEQLQEIDNVQEDNNEFYEKMDATNFADVLRSCERTEVALINSLSANAAQFPNGELIAANRFPEVLRMAALDFPSRYSHFVAHTSSSLRPAEVEFLKFSIHRDFVLEESLDQLSCVHQKHMHSIMRIHFLEENVVDAGGVHREWFTLLNDRLTEESAGLFRCTNASDQSFYLNPNSRVENGEDHLVYYYAVGRLIGRALLEGSVLSFHFAVPLLKLILGIPVVFEDLEYLDEEAYRGLVWLLENDDVNDLGLTFSVNEVMKPRESEVDGASHFEVIDLVPNGRDIEVTNSNKHAYVDRKFKYLVFESVARQLQLFLRGIYEVIPLELLALFDHEELDYILCGDQELDVDEWEKHTRVSPSLKGTPTLRWFWEVVREMPMEYRSRLLQFATGSSRLPASGFEGLTSYDGRLCPFTLKGCADFVPMADTQYIHGHACFNRIDLPFYKRKNDLEEVLYAILDTELYGFTES